MINSAIPRLRVFVAANVPTSVKEATKKIISTLTFVGPFFELLVSSSLLYQIKNLARVGKASSDMR